MSASNRGIRRYFSTTHSPLYSYFLCLPLFLLYEGLISLSQPHTNHIVRNAVDIWIQRLFSFISPNVIAISFIVMAILGLVVLYYERQKLSSLRLSYFVLMILEAAFYAILLLFMISFAVHGLLQIVPPISAKPFTFLQNMALSLGAGLYEELFFRVILVSLLVFLFGRIFNHRRLTLGVAMVLAAAIFSLAHYIGALGYPFTFRSFLFRFLFGLALNAIYLWRGFGMAAWTHAMYDLMILAFVGPIT